MSRISIFTVLLRASLAIIFPGKFAAVELSTNSTIYVPIYRTFYSG